jgi:hypothetical protein
MRMISASSRAAILLVAATLLLPSCGGGGGDAPPPPPPGPPTKLAYVNNPAGTASTWRAEVDPATNDTSKVTLWVYGPTGLQVQGATVFLTCSTRGVWAQPPAATDPYAAKGSALDLTSQGPDPSVQLFKSKLSTSGADLQVGAYQKQGAVALAGSPLFSVALSLKPSSTAGKANLIPTASKSCIYLDAAGVEHPFTLILGELTAK